MSASPIPVTRIPGVGPAREKLLGRLGVETVEDLLRRSPRDYADLRRPSRVAEMQEGRLVSVRGTVEAGAWRRSQKDRALWIGTARLTDGAGDVLRLQWFVKTVRGRRPRPLPGGARDRRPYIVTGVPRRSEDGSWYMQNPDTEPVISGSVHVGRIVPIYRLTDGLSQRVLRRIVWVALHELVDDIEDVLPAGLLSDTGFPPLAEALRQLHFPDDWHGLYRARQRLAFEELLLLRLAISSGRAGRGHFAHGRRLPTSMPTFLTRLPFVLTDAQRRVLAEVDADLSRSTPMQRLLQGDVGSGKTVVAAYALARAALAGGQAALIAPSEMLAVQHADTLTKWFAPDGIQVALLRGSTAARRRRDLLRQLRDGEPLVVVGTHALLQDDVVFSRLDVVVVDEQHRFGVEQRRALLRSHRPPHVLVVSATPIPRTLAHCVYGDLDVSTLDEKPPGREPPDTRWIRPSRRADVYRFVRHRIQEGSQAFVVYPSIGPEWSEEERGTTHAGLLQAARLLAAGPLRGVDMEIVHGRQSPVEQARAMERFRRGEARVLLATTLIEVGVDVPNASIIVVEGADMFGLAQLHQLRGRVGRGGGPSWCFLVAEAPTDHARRRLDALRRTTDGFEIARQDLALRGPGELLGVRQSGLPDLSPLGQSADARTLELVEQWARRIMTSGPGLFKQEEALWAAVARRSGEEGMMNGIGV